MTVCEVKTVYGTLTAYDTVTVYGTITMYDGIVTVNDSVLTIDVQSLEHSIHTNIFTTSMRFIVYGDSVWSSHTVYDSVWSCDSMWYTDSI